MSLDAQHNDACYTVKYGSDFSAPEQCTCELGVLYLACAGRVVSELKIANQQTRIEELETALFWAYCQLEEPDYSGLTHEEAYALPYFVHHRVLVNAAASKADWPTDNTKEDASGN